MVYFTQQQDWSPDLRAAAVAGNGEVAADLLAAAESQQHLVVGPYLVDVDLDTSGDLHAQATPMPRHIRERMRVHGPSVRQHAH